MKFLSPHMEIWSISFLLMMTIAFVVLNRLNYDVKGIDLERILYGLKTYAVLGVVFLLSWQPKGEDFLYHVYTGIYDLDMLLYFRRYIFGISESGTDIVLIHGYSPRSPFVISQINIILHLILIISIGISMIWWAIKFLKVKQYEFEIKDIGICLLIFAPVPHGIMKLAINQPVYLLNIIRLFGPILVFYTFIRIWQDNPRNYQGYFAIGYKDIKKNIPYIVIIMVVFLIFSHHILYVNHDIGHRYGNDDIRSNTATWIVDYQDSPTRVFTDWRTINRLRYSLSEENRNISELRDIRYRDHRYSYVIGMENESVADQFDFFVIDFHNIDKPLCAGGGYQDFKPLIYHYESIETNTNINKVYDAGHYEVFNNRY